MSDSNQAGIPQNILMPGDKFPEIEISLPRGEKLSLPGDIDDSWAYVMFYRGGW